MTGIKPSGTPHLGNYFGMIKPALDLVDEGQALYFIADYHALTTVKIPENLNRQVYEMAGREIYQSYIGSSANPGFRDFAIAALIVADRQVVDRVSLDINPTSRQILENLVHLGYLEKLIHAGARIHQPGCNGCIGMGQAPATGKISLRTVPRNFPGRSGTKGDQVYLCSPETAAVSALMGVITDPRQFDAPYPEYTARQSRNQISP